jgi:hypothetical protein
MKVPVVLWAMALAARAKPRTRQKKDRSKEVFMGSKDRKGPGSQFLAYPATPLIVMPLTQIPFSPLDDGYGGAIPAANLE